MALADTANLVVQLRLDDKFSGPLSRVQGNLGRLQSGFGRIGKGVGQVASGLNTLGTRAALAAAGGLTAVVTTAASFESAFAGVRKTVDASEADLKGLEGAFREMARTIPLSFEELSSLGEQAGALGIATKDIEEFTRVTALLGVTTDVTSDQAATALGQLSNVLGLTNADYERFASTLVDLGNKGASTESQILEIAQRAGAGAKLVGLASDQTLAWSSAVANLGIEVEAGGSALQKFFLGSLQNIQKDKTLEVMAETAGTTGKAFQQAFEKDASGALTTFITGLGKLRKAEQLAVLEALGFSDIRITRALLGLANSGDNLTKSLKTANAEWKRSNALQVEADKRFATTAAKFQILKNNVRDAAATIGTELLPVFNELAKEFVGFLGQKDTQAGIKTFAQDLASGIRGLVTELKGTDFSGIISGMKLAATVAKGAFDAFNALPGPVKQLAIAALIANKVSGGVVGQIAGGLASILGGGLGGVAGRAPIGGAPVAAGGGALGRAGGFLGTVGILAADVFLIAEAVGEFQRQSANVGVARDFVQRVVDDRSRNATVNELQDLNEDLKREIARETGDPLSGILKWSLVNSDLERQQREVERQIEVQTKQQLYNAQLSRQAIASGLYETRNEFRLGRLDQGKRLAAVERRVAEARNAVGTGFRQFNSQEAARDARLQSAISVANRNLAEGNNRQREIARRVAEQRDAIGSGFRRSNEQLGIIARKKTSFTADVNVTTNVTAHLSTYQSLTQLTRVSRIRLGTGFTPTLLNG